MNKKAMYRTAVVNSTEVEGYEKGEFVSVRFLGEGSFSPLFQISREGRPTIAVSEYDLTRFVL